MRTDLPTLDTATPPDGLPLYLEIRWFAEKVRRDGSGYGPGPRTWLEWAASASAMLTEQEGLISALDRRSAERDEARKERDALVSRRVVTVCVEHGDVLSSAWEDDDGDLLVTVEPCPLCARDRFDAGRRAAGRNP